MNGISNIEIINFESMDYDDEISIINENFGIECLTNFLVDKFQGEREFSYENILNESDNILLYTESITSKLKETPISQKNYDPPTNDSDSIRSVKFLSPEFLNENNILKPFPCFYENCKKSFKYKWILDRHFLSHKSIKIFNCTYKSCIKSYKSKENLTLHIKNIHLKIKPYSCRFCPSLFSHRNGNCLINFLGKTYHERKFHTNYLPHKCIIEGCTSNFASKSALSYHIKSFHVNKKTKKIPDNEKMGQSRFNREILKIVNGPNEMQNNFINQYECKYD